MLLVLLFISGIAVGFLAGWFFISSKKSVAASNIQNAESRIAELGRELAERSAKIDRLEREMRQLGEQKAQSEGRLAEKEMQIPKLERSIEQVVSESKELSQRLEILHGELVEAETTLQKDRESAAEKIAMLDEARQKLSDAFDSLSAKALATNNEQFLQLAKATMAEYRESAKGDLEKRQQAISEVVKPVGESLDKMNERIRELEHARTGAYATLTEQVRALSDGQTQLRSETSNLVRALRAPQTRGRWGEIQLRRVVELAGMVDHVSFETEVSVDTEEGRQRPDMIIKLPGGKSIIVDSKVPLAAYLEALETEDDVKRKEFMRAHARQVRDHITKLSRKSYWEQFEPTPEFVIMFLSGEAFLYAALEYDPGLIEDAVGERVILATPTTLIAMLKSIAYGWRQENLEKNAKEIGALGAELYKRLSTAGDHLDNIGKHLDLAVESYNKSVGSIERNVLSTARKLKEHDVGVGDAIIEVPRQIEAKTRALTAPELFPPTNGELAA